MMEKTVLDYSAAPSPERIPMTITIGNLSLGRKPAVTAIIDRLLSLAEITALPERGADMLEIRADLIDAAPKRLYDYIREIRENVDLPLIGTLRETTQNKDRRLAMFEKIVPLVDCVDIEIDASINRDIVAMAGEKPVIISEHDFEKTPSNDRLKALVEKGMELGGTIVKIAVMPRSREDVSRLLTFTGECSAPIVTIAMGEIGVISRVAAPLFGSLFTYAFISDSVAPGQLSIDMMAEEIGRYYPG
ncbi:MAG: type I 3-dehydroquinate dehydratase [Chitinivibrionales bacterium]|nr:type I 3-dehydroquinate dehydratase [Chitinivibrionales bacterium]